MRPALLLSLLAFAAGCEGQTETAQLPGGGAADEMRNAAAATATADAPEKSPQQFIADTLQYNLDHRLLSVERNAAWQVLHGVLAYGRELPLGVGDRRVPAVQYLLEGGELRGWELSRGTDLGDGRLGIRSRVEAGGYISQGHVDQWLAILAQIGVGLDEKVVVAGREHTVADWVDQALLDVPHNPLHEYSWTLISAIKYRPDRREWTGVEGSRVELAKIVDFEATQDITASACGGSHRLMSLAIARDYAEANGLANEPAYVAAAETLHKSLETMKRYQNGDGSFSADYFARPGISADLSLMISATGHQLELAAYALSDAEVRAPWVQRAAIRLCEYLEAAREQPLECGGLYHGLNGLRIYHNRLYGQWKPAETASKVASMN